MSNQAIGERIGELLKKQVSLVLHLDLLERRPQFKLAAAFTCLIDAVMDDDMDEAAKLRETIKETFPRMYPHSLSVCGITHEEVFRFLALNEEIETNEKQLRELQEQMGAAK